MTFQNNTAYAAQLDQNDSLKEFRNEFYIPKFEGNECIYFCGNSLGLQPKITEQYIREELEDWKKLGVKGHFHAKRPWFSYHHLFKSSLAKLVGALPEEVTPMNSLTTNLQLLLTSFYRPTATRYKILVEEGAFPSDYYTVASQANLHGYSAEQAIVELKPKPNNHTLTTQDILHTIEQLGDAVALILLPGVQYYTGQLFDMHKITEVGKKVGAVVGFDLAHAAGNVPLKLHDWGVDFAAWCSYKYLNSGPGATGALFVHQNHDPKQHKLNGWWGTDENTRFFMKKEFEPMKGADAWQLSNKNVLSLAAQLASLSIFDRAGIQNLRNKSIQLTDYLIFIVNEINKSLSIEIQIITPRNLDERGAQLSLIIPDQLGKTVFEALSRQHVVVDWREPDVIRMAPVPLYNTFMDVFRFGQILHQTLDKNIENLKQTTKT